MYGLEISFLCFRQSSKTVKLISNFASTWAISVDELKRSKEITNAFDYDKDISADLMRNFGN